MNKLKIKLKNFYSHSPITLLFMAIILGAFIFMTLNGGTTNSETLVRYGAFYPPFILAYGEYYRFITAIFIHIGLSHFLFNSYALYIFGPLIERLMGGGKYFIFFLLTGIGGNVLTFFFNFNSISAGASGSLFGILGAFLYIIRKYPHMVTAAARQDLISLLVINLLLTIIVPSISITAHFGGLIVGYLLSFIFIG